MTGVDPLSFAVALFYHIILFNVFLYFPFFLLSTVMDDYDYSFSQNGLVAYKGGKLIGQQVSGQLIITRHCGI